MPAAMASSISRNSHTRRCAARAFILASIRLAVIPTDERDRLDTTSGRKNFTPGRPLVSENAEAYRDRWSDRVATYTGHHCGQAVAVMHMDANVVFLTVVEDGSPAVIATPEGDFGESDAIDLMAQLLGVLARNPRHLVLDLSHVTAMDPTVVRALDLVEKQAAEVGCDYRLANPTPVVATALHAVHRPSVARRTGSSRLDAVAVARRLARRRAVLHN
nr:STAS domain-containing protein [Tenggerimyces flavus]